MNFMLTNADIAQRRLHNQRLASTAHTQPQSVVQELGAIQAQDYAGAKWAVAQRAQGLSDAALDQALADGTILRTHVLRPTWHFVAPADIRWMLALTAPRVSAFNAYYYRKCGLDDAVFQKSNAALTKALQGGKQLTRPELTTALAQAGIATDELRGTHLMMQAELDGVVCSGARRGKQFTYALLEERVPPAKPRTRDEALAELATRYLHSRGPATVKDFVWWSGLSTADAKTAIAMVQDQFNQMTMNGQTFWFPDDLPIAPTQAPTAHLLSTYDEYLIAYKDRSAVIYAANAEQIIGGEVFTSTILLNGQVAGVWKRRLQKREVMIELQLFSALKETERNAVALAAERYGAFLGLSVTLIETGGRKRPTNFSLSSF